MQTVQIVLDESLLRAADEAARRAKLNRSALVRKALEQYLLRVRTEELERLDREGYERVPQDPEEIAYWERAAVWPDE